MTVRRRRSPPNLHSPCVLRRSWIPLTSGGTFPVPPRRSASRGPTCLRVNAWVQARKQKILLPGPFPRRIRQAKETPFRGLPRLPLSHPLAYCGRRGSPLRVSQCAIRHPAPPNLPRWPWWGTGLSLPTVTRPLMPSGWARWRSVGRLPMPSRRTGVPPVSRARCVRPHPRVLPVALGSP